MVDLDIHWTEILAVIFGSLGFLLGLSLGDPLARVVIIFIAGLAAGRIYDTKKHKSLTLPSVIIIAGFVLGYSIGAFFTGSIWSIPFFIVAFMGSSYIHSNSIIAIFKSAKPFK